MQDKQQTMRINPPEEHFIDRRDIDPSHENEYIDVAYEWANDQSNATFNKYLAVTQYNHQKKVNITPTEIAKYAPATLFSYIVGTIAALSYIKPSQDAADNQFEYYANPIGAMTLNAIVNGYFLNIVSCDVVDFLEDILNPSKSREVQGSLDQLKNLSPGLWSMLGRGAKKAIIIALISIPAIASAVPFYILDNGARWRSTMVLIAATLLQYKGVEGLILDGVLPILKWPYQALYRRYNAEAMKTHKIITTISLFKMAHLEAFSSAMQEILKHIQTNNEVALAQIYPLLMKEAPTKLDTLLLLTNILKLAKSDEYQPSPIGRTIVQIISLIMTTASLPGYYFETVDGIGADTPLEGFWKWTISTGIFGVSVALSLVVGWLVGGDLYNLVGYALNGAKNSWRESTSTFNFLYKGLKGTADFTKWFLLGMGTIDLAGLHKFVRFPLSIIQNPRMLNLMAPFFIESYWSTQTSTYLNEKHLADLSKYLFLMTVISVILFNTFPLDKVLGSGQRVAMRSFGSEKSKKEIKLEQFLQDQIAFIQEITGTEFLNLLDDIMKTLRTTPTDREEFIKLFLGNKTPEEIFGRGHKYGKRQYSEIITCLSDKSIEQLSQVGFFSQRRDRQTSTSINLEEGYGTRSNEGSREDHRAFFSQFS